MDHRQDDAKAKTTKERAFVPSARNIGKKNQHGGGGKNTTLEHLNHAGPEEEHK